MFSGYFGKATAEIGTEKADASLLRLKNGVREINSDTDQARENLFMLRRVGQQILSGMIRAFEGTKFAQIAQISQNVLITASSIATMQTQAAGALVAGNLPAYYALQALSTQQVFNLIQAENLKMQTEQQQDYLDRLTAMRNMYS